MMALTDKWATALLAAGGLCAILVACNAGGRSVPAASGFTGDERASTTSATPTPVPYSFKTVDDPISGFNEVTGINSSNGGKIVGSVKIGVSVLQEGYTSQPPYTKFTLAAISGAAANLLNGLNDKRVAVGYVVAPPGLSGTWALVKDKTLFDYKCPKEGPDSDHVTELWGINDANTAVGYYINGSGVSVPMESNVTKENCNDLSTPPGAAGAIATGITNKGDIAGYYWNAGGSSTKPAGGFLIRAGTQYVFAFPDASSTTVYGLNYSDQIVGSFVDSKANTHGFILTNPTKAPSQQIWQQIDDPNATSGITVVTGINLKHTICGYYTDSSGTYHGFVATVSSS